MSVLRLVVCLMLNQNAVGRCGPNKYDSLRLRIKTSYGAQVAEDAPLPLSDEVPDNKQILRQTIRVHLIPAFKHCKTVFTREVLFQQYGAVVSYVIASC